MPVKYDLKQIPLLQKLNNYGEEGLKTPIRGIEVGTLLQDYVQLTDLLPSIDSPAICDPLNQDRIPLTHKRLKKFITEEYDLTKFGIQHGSRVGILLPNGPELAVALLSTISKWCAAPINATNTWEEIKMELQSTKACAIIILAGVSTNEASLKAAEALGLAVITIASYGSVAGLFHMTLLHPKTLQAPINPPTLPPSREGFVQFKHPEIVLLLHTSGTSGNKKLVPYSLDMIIVGVGSIVASWNLKPSDVCLNMMPLFHIGGIVRNILSPVLSGGSVITCSGFDPLLFWDLLYQGREEAQSSTATIPQITWYYAAPTMHHAILNEAERRPTPLPVDSVRYIANAAGGLLPVLATALRDTFQAVILTSYGMTECMPISTPPQNYALQPTGTSGTGVGPDLLIVNDDLKVCTTGDKGNIFIRGPPCFAGYETTNPATNDESFFNVPGHGSGWFNTGDMGSLDSQGYLFISGRSKEIINRGGETISPFEIEEAIQQHPHVKETLAFSAPHASYQESVGVIIVTKSNMTRVDLPTLHKYLEDKLHRSKWPQLIVYSDALPKNATGKTLRIRYAERIKLGDVDEESSPSLRLYEAACPPLGTALTVSIPLQSVKVDLSITKQFLQKFDGMQAVEVVRVDLASQHDAIIALIVTKEDTKQVIEAISQQSKAHLHSYLTPSYVYAVPSIPTKKEGKHVVVDYQALQQLALDQFQQQNIIAPRNAIEQQLELIWRSSLGCATMISINTSFFDLGGDSLKAGQVVASIRSQLRIPLSVADLLTAQTIEALAVKISKEKVLGSPKISSRPSPSQSSYQRNLGGKNSKLEAIAEEGEDAEQHRLQREFMTWDFSPPLSNNSFTCLFVQALPIALIYPLRRIVIWFLIAGPWVSLMKAGHGRFTSLLIAMFLARLLLGFGAPLVGIACKWLIIGKYKAGKYPLWGTMYLKWWLVEQIINIMGKGFFRDDLPIIGPHLVRWYYYLMGAQMGNNVQIHKDAKIGQADLLNIGDNVAIDNCTIRPFAIEEGHFVLLPITIGSNSSVGLKSVVAGGSTLPPDSHIGPLSSSHEVETDSDPIFRKYCRPTYQSPPALYIICFGLPVLLLVLVISFIPWFFVLRMMVSHAKEQGWYQSDIHSIYHAFLWWITPQRLMFFFLLRVVKRCIVPILRLAAIILIKWTIIGEFKEMQEEEKLQPWNRFRYWLMAKLLPGGSLGGVSKLVGTHYEMVSIIYRLLGAKVGKRVYWPGSGLEIVEYDLFEVGDDVVFGSRSVVITSSTKASKRIVLEAGTMVADRCVILPGVTLGKGAVLGSGALAYEDMTIEVGSVWLGSQHGSALNVAPKDLSYASKNTTTPFGKAFYEGKANYFVLPLWMIILYNTTWQAFCTCYRNCPTALALIICSYIKQFDPFDDHSALELFKMTLVAFSPLYITLCFTALTVDVVGKWLLLGRRKAGEYAWDQSSYCQRWQMYLTLQEIRRGERHKTGVLDMIQGSQFLVWYFRALGATIGNNVCLYPNGGDPMFTEPDLVTIGDFVGVDDASLIAHINTRGVFRLNPLVVGNGCILKSMSRLLSGATMEPHSILLEHTLVLAGEQVEAGSVWQGWPSRSQVSLKAYRQQVNYNLDQVSMQTIRTLRSATKKPRPTEEEEGIAMKQSPSHPSIGIAIKKLTPQRKGSKDNLKKLSLDDDTVLNHKTQSAFNMKDDMDGYDDRQPLLLSFSGTKDKKKSSYTDL